MGDPVQPVQKIPEPPQISGDQGISKQRGILKKISSTIKGFFTFKKDVTPEMKTPKQPIPAPAEKKGGDLWFRQIFSSTKKTAPTEPSKEIIEKKWTDTECLTKINELVDLLSSQERFLQPEGILRISGDREVVQSFLKERDKPVGLEQIKGEGVHDVTGVLKSVWREVPFDNEVLVQAVNIGNKLKTPPEKEISQDDLKALQESLTPQQKKIFDKMITYAVAIASKSQTNKMGPKNIAIVLAPGLARGNVIDPTSQDPKFEIIASKMTGEVIAFFEAVITYNLNNPNAPLKFS